MLNSLRQAFHLHGLVLLSIVTCCAHKTARMMVQASTLMAAATLGDANSADQSRPKRNVRRECPRRLFLPLFLVVSSPICLISNLFSQDEATHVSRLMAAAARRRTAPRRRWRRWRRWRPESPKIPEDATPASARQCLSSSLCTQDEATGMSPQMAAPANGGDRSRRHG